MNELTTRDCLLLLNTDSLVRHFNFHLKKRDGVVLVKTNCEMLCFVLEDCETLVAISSSVLVECLQLKRRENYVLIMCYLLCDQDMFVYDTDWYKQSQGHRSITRTSTYLQRCTAISERSVYVFFPLKRFTCRRVSHIPCLETIYLTILTETFLPEVLNNGGPVNKQWIV